jgi:hypothetical protein
MAALGWVILAGVAVGVMWCQWKVVRRWHAGRADPPPVTSAAYMSPRPGRHVRIVSFLIDQSQAIVAFALPDRVRAPLVESPSATWGTLCVEVGADGGDTLSRWQDEGTDLELTAEDGRMRLRSRRENLWLVVR